MTSPAFQAPGQHLAAVPHTQLPDFEGIQVMSTSMKITGTVPVVSDNDVLVSIDDRVRLVGEFRVVGVNFKLDPKTGDTVREQVLKPIEVTLCPYDPSNPTDNGIIKARP